MGREDLGGELAVPGAQLQNARVGDVGNDVQGRAGIPFVIPRTGAHPIQRCDHGLLDLVGDVVTVGVLQLLGLQPPIEPGRIRTTPGHRRDRRIHC